MLEKPIVFFYTFASPFREQWSVRLGVRTSGFHPGNRGSIPLPTTGKCFQKQLKNPVNYLQDFLVICSWL